MATWKASVVVSRTESSSRPITSIWFSVKLLTVYVLVDSVVIAYIFISFLQLSILSDLKLHLQSTDYGQFLANEPSPLAVSVIDDRLREKLVIEFQHMRNQAVEPLATFLDYITQVSLAPMQRLQSNHIFIFNFQVQLHD